jgi:hypothetical protein
MYHKLKKLMSLFLTVALALGTLGVTPLTVHATGADNINIVYLHLVTNPTIDSADAFGTFQAPSFDDHDIVATVLSTHLSGENTTVLAVLGNITHDAYVYWDEPTTLKYNSGQKIFLNEHIYSGYVPDSATSGIVLSATSDIE